MFRHRAPAALLGLVLVATRPLAAQHNWNVRAAADYLDARMTWWLGWTGSQRDRGTSCISCHTAMPYALARPALRAALQEAAAAPEQRMLANVTKRATMWREVEPFYPDQTRGLPKTSESRGTESVLNALILATRDAQVGTVSDAGRAAFTHMWAQQFRAGALKGAWAWLNFRYEPWEADGSPYFGAALAAVAVGRAPGNYGSSIELKPQVELLRDYLRRNVDSVNLYNRAMGLWGSSHIAAFTPEQRQRAIDALVAVQRTDGGWSLGALGTFRRQDSTTVDTRSDGLATGLVLVALQAAGLSREYPPVRLGLAWLRANQDTTTGMWAATSLNKARDPSSDIGKFMSDAATAYAVLALSGAR